MWSFLYVRMIYFSEILVVQNVWIWPKPLPKPFPAIQNMPWIKKKKKDIVVNTH